MEAHASKPDVYSIPIISLSIRKEVARNRIWREERKTLRAKTENLRQLHYTADFLEN